MALQLAHWYDSHKPASGKAGSIVVKMLYLLSL